MPFDDDDGMSEKDQRRVLGWLWKKVKEKRQRDRDAREKEKQEAEEAVRSFWNPKRKDDDKDKDE